MSGAVILAPVLRRPHRVAPLLASADPVRVLFIASPSDTATHQAVSEAGGDLLILDRDPEPGDFARKINAGYKATTEELLFLGADDLDFHDGWLDAATAKLDGRTHVVGTNDLGSPRVIKGHHATHSLVTRAYVDRYGTIDERGKVLHEGYPHEFVDDEFVGTAKFRGAWAFAKDSIVEHLHPNWGKAPTDELYDAQFDRMKAGAAVWKQRRHLWRG